MKLMQLTYPHQAWRQNHQTGMNNIVHFELKFIDHTGYIYYFTNKKISRIPYSIHRAFFWVLQFRPTSKNMLLDRLYSLNWFEWVCKFVVAWFPVMDWGSIQGVFPPLYSWSALDPPWIWPGYYWIWIFICEIMYLNSCIWRFRLENDIKVKQNFHYFWDTYKIT